MKVFARVRRPKKARANILFRYGWKVTLLLLLAGAVFAVFLFYGTWAQTFDMKNVGEMPERSTVFDVDGKIYSRLAGANRLKVSLSEVSPEFIAAVLAREDTRFYDHKGIDWRGILRALVPDTTSGSAKEGAAASPSSLPETAFHSVAAPLAGKYWKRWSRCALNASLPNSRFWSFILTAFISVTVAMGLRPLLKLILARTLQS